MSPRLHEPQQDWTIREAALADLEAVVELRMAMGDELASSKVSDLSDAEIAERRATALEGNRVYAREHLGKDMTSWLAFADGEAIASAAVYWFRHPPSTMRPTGLEAYILNVYTRPAFRHKGVARALMEVAVETARSAGAERIWLRTSEQGRPLYESMGFGQRNYLELQSDLPKGE